jgi:hypothetical protein
MMALEEKFEITLDEDGKSRRDGWHIFVSVASVLTIGFLLWCRC